MHCSPLIAHGSNSRNYWCTEYTNNRWDKRETCIWNCSYFATLTDSCTFISIMSGPSTRWQPSTVHEARQDLSEEPEARVIQQHHMEYPPSESIILYEATSFLRNRRNYMGQLCDKTGRRCVNLSLLVCSSAERGAYTNTATPPFRGISERKHRSRNLFRAGGCNFYHNCMQDWHLSRHLFRLKSFWEVKDTCSYRLATREKGDNKTSIL